ncbi:WD repeat domain phosphoinositide-interacting protein 3 [Phlyctochytrium bullatum]|nr:WD repeat domain phosphoinositide-interacting protein 3 [Phlyctochytrium bullatum]
MSGTMNLTQRPLSSGSGHPSSSLRASTSTSAATAPISTSASNTTEAHNAAQGLLYIGFNQDSSCFAVGTVAGFRIYNTDPVHERARREHVPLRPEHPTFVSEGFGADGAVPTSKGKGKARSKPPKMPSKTNRASSSVTGNTVGEQRGKNRGRSDSDFSIDSLPEIEDYDGESEGEGVGDSRLFKSAFEGLPGKEEESDDEGDEEGDEDSEDEMTDKDPPPLKGPFSDKSNSPPLIVEVEDDSDDYGFELELDDDPLSPNPEAGSENEDGKTKEGSGLPPTLPPRPSLDRPGGIAIVEMLYRSNYVVLVGGGRNPKFPPNRVIVWDDHRGRVILQMQFKSEVKAVKLRKDRMVIVFWNRVSVYTFSPRPRRLHTFETVRNDRGLVALAPTPLAGIGGRPNTAVLAFMGRMTGQVQICELRLGPLDNLTPSKATNLPGTSQASRAKSPEVSHAKTTGSTSTEQLNSSKPGSDASLLDKLGGSVLIPGTITSEPQPARIAISPPTLPNPPISIIAAHNSGLACFALSTSGHLLATASETGTLIRVFDTRSGRLINELRRGLDRAEIFCIAFNTEGTRLCVSSDKGTIHVFNVMGTQNHAQSLDPAVANSLASSELAYPPRTVSPGGVVISGLGGNVMTMSPFSSQMPDIGYRSTSPNVAPSNIRRNSTSSTITTTAGTSLTSSLTNRLSTLSFFSPISKYFSSEWSFAQFSLPVETRCICVFAASDRADDGPAAAARSAAQAMKSAGKLPKPPDSPASHSFQDPQPGAPNTQPSKTTSKAMYFDPKTMTATATFPTSNTATAAEPAYVSDWSTGPVTSANAILCLCADGSAYKFSFEAPPNAPSTHSAANAPGGGNPSSMPNRDGVMESFTKFYKGVGVDPEGGRITDEDGKASKADVQSNVRLSAEGFVISTGWGGDEVWDDDDD